MSLEGKRITLGSVPSWGYVELYDELWSETQKHWYTTEGTLLISSQITWLYASSCEFQFEYSRTLQL